MKAKIDNGFTASKSTLNRVLKSEKHLKYLKRKSAPKLKPIHKENRLKWAKNYMSFGDNWRKVIFSDEKKFNLDGPDGFKYYWHDIRTAPQYYSKRAFGGGSLMVLATIGWAGRSELVFINGRMNSQDYKNMLEKYLVPFSGRICGEGWLFQQDNCSVHTSKLMAMWFEAENIAVIDWPSLSPDFNIIENMWAELVRRVYANGRQFSTVAELKRVLIQEWEEISQSYIQNLFNSMNYRIYEVIRNK